jgi:hypothetical protein
VHKKIETDEKFHVGLGRQILSRYAASYEDRAEILRAMRAMRDIASNLFTPPSEAALLR